MKTWMVVERLENWQVDADSNFSTISFPNRYARRLNQFSVGDQLFTYVASRISAFADVREVVGLAKAGRSSSNALDKYDSVYPITLLTKPVLVLPDDRWVPFRDLADQLSLTKDLRDWRYIVRCALRELAADDADIIRLAMDSSSNQPSRKLSHLVANW